MSERTNPSPLGCLSQSQRAVLDLLTQFKSLGEIAAELGLPTSTVDARIDLAQAKLGAKSRADLALVYAELRKKDRGPYSAPERDQPEKVAVKAIVSIFEPPPLGGAERNTMCWDFTIFPMMQIAFLGLLCFGALMLLVLGLYRVLG